MKKYPDFIEQKIRTLAMEGVHHKDIQERLGVAITTIYEVRRKYGLIEKTRNRKRVPGSIRAKKESLG